MKKIAAMTAIIALVSMPVLAAGQGGFTGPSTTTTTQAGGFTGMNGNMPARVAATVKVGQEQAAGEAQLIARQV